MINYNKIINNKIKKINYNKIFLIVNKHKIYNNQIKNNKIKNNLINNSKTYMNKINNNKILKKTVICLLVKLFKMIYKNKSYLQQIILIK